MEFIFRVLHLIWLILPFALPVLTGYLAWELWRHYVQEKFAASKPKILLEVKLPQVINKSPLAMELVLTALYITSREGTFVDRIFKGQSRPSFSLELISVAGRVHFFIRTEVGYKNLIEANIYAQYPGVEVTEAPDYTQGIVFDPAVNSMWACEYIKTHNDVLPIKTYVDYGMDKDPKEEYKIDPMTSTLEFLGSIKQNQQVWFQIMIRAHKKERKIPGKTFGTHKKVDWTHAAEEYRKDMLKKLKDEKNKDAPARRMTRGEEAIITALDRNVSKLPFDVGMRGIYFASHADSFNPTVISGIVGLIRQYNALNLNGFKFHKQTSFDYLWQDFNDVRVNKMKKNILKHYKWRYFFGLGGRKPFTMSTEELATMYHFPGGVAATPTFARIMSKKSEPPANLPQ